MSREPYLDPAVLASIDAAAVRSAEPYPWQSVVGLLRDEARAELAAALPEVDAFRGVFGRRRRYGRPWKS